MYIAIGAQTAPTSKVSRRALDFLTMSDSIALGLCPKSLCIDRVLIRFEQGFT